MSKDHSESQRTDDSAIYRLRWVADAMKAAKHYAEENPDEVQAVQNTQPEDLD